MPDPLTIEDVARHAVDGDRNALDRLVRDLQRDVYGWFARIARGTYALSDRGHAALGQFAEAVTALADQRAVA